MGVSPKSFVADMETVSAPLLLQSLCPGAMRTRTQQRPHGLPHAGCTLTSATAEQALEGEANLGNRVSRPSRTVQHVQVRTAMYEGNLYYCSTGGVWPVENSYWTGSCLSILFSSLLYVH